MLADSDFTDIEPEKEKKNTTKKVILTLSIVLVLGAAAALIPLFLKKEQKTEIYTMSGVQDEDLDFTEEEHRKLSRKFAGEAMVLATNNALPLNRDDQVVLFGKGTTETIYGGTGSGEVYEKGTNNNIKPIKVKEGFETKGKEGKIKYVNNDKGLEIGAGLSDADVRNFAQKQGGAKRSVAVMTISRVSGEGSDRPQDASLKGTKLTEEEKNTYKSLSNYFDKVVVVLNVGSVIELEGWEKDPKTTILIAFLPGMEAGNAIADVVVGDAYPSGHLTDTWAKTIDDYSTTATFKENPLFVKYKEGLFMGYRYFEDDGGKQGKIVFPFGHGLSYTTYQIQNSCAFNGDIFTISSKVKNTGGRVGKQVVQVYVEKPQNEKFIKVKRELVGFAKTKELKPGEEQELKIEVKLNSLASYDDTGVTGNMGCYVLEKGEYKLYVGTSVAETRQDSSRVHVYNQNNLKVTERLTPRLQPKDAEVADANTKPKFAEFMYKDLRSGETQVENEEPKEVPIRKAVKGPDEDENTDIPTDNLAKINFKGVLEKKNTFEELADVMTDQELAFISFGHYANIKSGTGSIGGTFNTGVIGKYFIPSAETLDGPAGLRQSEPSMQSTAWPCSTALASTFDVDVMRVVGEETGKEARKVGCSFWLAPGMNIHRSPLCGRNFEYYSEDPFLTGKMAAAITKGLQSKRVSITLKHFAFNDKEQNRNGDDDKDNHMASDSRMAERVAREIYLKGFEIAVKEGQPWAVMTSYNRMNAVKTAENFDLIEGILRGEWGYSGLVMTDWGTNSKNDREANAGGDVKMPGGFEKEILDGVRQGAVTRAELKRNAVHIFKTLARTAAADSLTKQPKPITINNNAPTRIKLADSFYHKSQAINYENCADEDKGRNLCYCGENRWVTYYIDNPHGDMMKKFKIRYSAVEYGFGFMLRKGDKVLGEINNVEITGAYQNWKDSPTGSVFLPKGTYELTLFFTNYDYIRKGGDKGNVNWLEIF